LSGAHMTLFPRILDELHKRGLDDMIVWAGGIIPQADAPRLREMGIAAIFGPGSPTTKTIEFLRHIEENRAAAVQR
jgi:methylmalonyl-CoA mutase, C-terminal domain